MTNSKRRKLLANAIRRLKQTDKGYNTEGGHWRAAMALLEELDQDLKPDPSPDVPVLGPVEVGGVPLTKLSLTHQTSGLPLYPAVDTVWTAGTRVLAPEAGIVTRHSGGPSGGYSVYLTGNSGLKYYFTHMNPETRAPIGRINKGKRVGVVGSPSRFPGQRIAHVHLGVNIEGYPGVRKGEQLKYGRNGNGPDYTTGSPTIGEQLSKL